MMLEEIPADAPESIAQSIVPYNRDDDRARYLGLRASGFAIREALKLLGKAKSTLSAWRHDEVFSDLESRIPELRKTLATEYVGLEFLRNFRLVLEKDYRVIKKSLFNEDEMTLQENQYLTRMRAYYTPQQLQVMEALIRGESDGSGEFNFTDLAIELSRTTERVKIETRDRSGEAQLAHVVVPTAEEQATISSVIKREED